MDKNKKGFTLLELVFVLVISAIMANIALHEYEEHMYQQRLKVFTNNIDAIINYAIIDSKTGYVNGSGGYCSDDNTFKDITSCRAIKCASLEHTYVLYEKNNKCDKNQSDSYVKKMLLVDTDGKGCNLYTKPDSDDDSIFYVYIDCSNLNSNRKKTNIENLLAYNIKTNFNIILQNTYKNATSIDNTDGGNENDGKISFKFKD